MTVFAFLGDSSTAEILDPTIADESQTQSEVVSVDQPPVNITDDTLQTQAQNFNIPSNDFAFYVGSGGLNDRQILDALENRWCPLKQDDYPHSSHKKNGVYRRRSLNRSHLERYKWLAVSQVGDKAGAWCAECVLFSASYDYNGQRMGKLVTRPLTDFSDLTGNNGALDVHERSGFPAASMARALEFRQRANDPVTHVDAQIDKQKKQQILQNRKALASIVDTIKLCAIQNIPLRGHRDDGRINPDGTYPPENDGNFRMLLRFRVQSGDSNLQKHLHQAKGNALYSSKTTQNELLQVSADIVRQNILQRLSASPCLAVMADETTDRANREQLVMAFRYVDMHEGVFVVREDPVEIIDLIASIRELKNNRKITDDIDAGEHDNHTEEMRMSGENIAAVIMRKLCEIPVEATKIIAQCYDGAAAMSSDRIGVAAFIKTHAANADYFHCANHGLNLATSQITSVDVVRNAQSTMELIITFMTDSAKRLDLLTHTEANADANTTHKLIKLCQTRFVERHVAVERFWEQIPSIAEALEMMQAWKDRKASGKATTMLNSLLKTEFLVGVRILQHLAAYLRPLSLALQEKGLDLTRALDKVDAVMTVLTDMREAVEREFHQLFTDVTDVASTLGFTVSTPYDQHIHVTVKLTRLTSQADCLADD